MTDQFAAVFFAVLAALSGCNGAGSENEAGSRPSATDTASSKVVAAPTPLLRRCQRIRVLAPACPQRLPSASFVSGRKINRGSLPYRTFNIEAGVAYADPAKNAPPSFLHVVAEAGNLHDSFVSFRFPTTGPVTAPLNGLMTSEKRDRLVSRVPQAVFLGRVTWSGITGIVALAPPYNAVSSIHGDHVVFRWKRDGAEYALSLHAWEPFSECFATLRAMVESLHPQ